MSGAVESLGHLRGAPPALEPDLQALSHWSPDVLRDGDLLVAAQGVGEPTVLLQTLLASAQRPRDLELFGFPPPGHPIWTEDLLRTTALRYPNLDLTPWRSALVGA